MTRTFRFNITGELVEVGEKKPSEAFFFLPPVPKEMFDMLAWLQRERENALGIPPGVWGTKG